MLSPGLQVDNSNQYLLFIIVRKAEDSRRALVLEFVSKLDHFVFF